MDGGKEMRVLGGVPTAANSVLFIKEEVEFKETQLQEHFFYGVEVKQSGADETVKAEERIEILNRLSHEAEQNQTELNDCETKTIPYSETIKEQPHERYLSPGGSDSLARVPVDIKSRRKAKHSCSVCTKSFKCKSRLNDHMKLHSGSRPHACATCPKRYRRPSGLRKHKLICGQKVMTQNTHKCALCEKSYRSISELDSHMNVHHGERPYKCEICPLSFTHRNTLFAHQKIHRNERNFECTLCNKKFIFKRERRNHEKTHSNDRYNYQCGVCKKYFRLEDQYRSHLEDNKCIGYATEKPFECSKCDKEAFASIELLNRHKSEMHSPPKKNHICSVCSKAYRRKAELGAHMNFHRDERLFKCELCSKSFWSKELILKHNQTQHSDDLKYECKLCNKKFRDSSNRNQHEKTHSNQRSRYQCNICKNYFKFKEQYRSHSEDNKCTGKSQDFQIGKSEQLLQAANQIEYNGTSKKSRNDNVFEKKYKCGECNKEFICNRNLAFHLRSHLASSSTRGETDNF